jgi:hypothetical protein
MSDDQRVYSEEEFALVLRKAAELANRTGPLATSSTGLTLAEMKAAAAQAGFDPALVERAAWLLGASPTPSALERLLGGPLRHEHRARFPIRLDENGAARLLSAVRISASVAGRRDAGHSSSVGMTWHDGGDVEPLSITARPEEHGTAVSVALDRRGTLGMVTVISGMAMFFAAIFSGSTLYAEAPALGLGGFIAGMGATLMAARGYWVSSTRKVRERISVAMETIGQTLTLSGRADEGPFTPPAPAQRPAAEPEVDLGSDNLLDA